VKRITLFLCFTRKPQILGRCSPWSTWSTRNTQTASWTNPHKSPHTKNKKGGRTFFDKKGKTVRAHV